MTGTRTVVSGIGGVDCRDDDPSGEGDGQSSYEPEIPHSSED
jgi:hypothetical protein